MFAASLAHVRVRCPSPLTNRLRCSDLWAGILITWLASLFRHQQPATWGLLACTLSSRIFRLPPFAPIVTPSPGDSLGPTSLEAGVQACNLFACFSAAVGTEPTLAPCLGSHR